jgi:endonuclease/exonuclease/phosphatase family metal-dependent hydrolase
VPEAGLRIATFNASLNRAAEGELVEDLSTADDQQAANVAAILQHTRPDVVLLNEFDYVEDGQAVELFRTNYLLLSQQGAQPIDYPYSFIAPSNTGVPSGFDLDNDGTVGGANDALGFGEFLGQFGMVVLSRYPIVEDEVRTFQNLLWQSMPGSRLPDDPATAEPADWYSPNELAVLPLSSKSHWDVPVDVDGRIIHVLASHPTPPVFDGPEDRNGMRNADEIAFWADYIAGADAAWIIDDAGTPGGLAANAEFVIVGDLNSDPLDGDSLPGATDQLLALDRVQDPHPESDGAALATLTQRRANDAHTGDPALDTADFADDTPGNLRVDYVLPSDGFTVVDAGVFWPQSNDQLGRLVIPDPQASSDHRLVWVDLS